MLKSIVSLKKFKKKNLRKKTHLLECFFFNVSAVRFKFFRKITVFYFYTKLMSFNKRSQESNPPSINLCENVKTLTITQKTDNLKTTLTINSLNVNTLTIGTLLKNFKIKQGKFLRRSIKGTKILFSSLRNILQKKYKVSNALFLIKLSGFNYNLTFLKRSLAKNFISGSADRFIFLLNLKVSFSKRKEKKKKSIKKRLKKKMLLSFLKSNKINLV